MQNNFLKPFSKYVVLLLCSLQTLALSAVSQSSGTGAPFVKGSKSLGLSAGFGIGYNYISGYSGLPVLALTYDQGFFENAGPGNIGIGAIVALKTAHYNYSGGHRAVWKNYFVGIRGTYHLTILADKNNKFDPYAGVTLGVRIYRYDDTYSSYANHSLYPVAGAFVGAKYNFARNIGAFAELGYDISFARIGISLNF